MTAKDVRFVQKDGLSAVLFYGLAITSVPDRWEIVESAGTLGDAR